MYRIKFTKKGSDYLSKLPKSIIHQIKNKAIRMSENAETIPHKKLRGIDFENLYKLRVGDYRIIYELDNRNKIITIVKTGHRKDIYKVK